MSEIDIPRAFEPLFDTEYRDFAFYGGRGGAKSHSVAGALVCRAVEKPLRIVCAREIQESLRDSVKQLIEDKIGGYGFERHFEILRDEIKGRNGSRFVFKGMWRNPDALKSLEGADIFWGEEANRFSARSIRLIRPTLRKPGSQMIWTWNPEFDHDPIDKLFRGSAGPPPPSEAYPKGSLVRKVGHADNPWFAGTPLQAEMENDYRVDHDTADHVWGGGYVRAVDGAYYSKQLAAVHAEGRVTTLSVDPLARVRAFWDLGKNDATAIWIVQFIGREVRILDYIEGRGQGLGYYINELQARGWSAALQELPHDGANDTVISHGSAAQQLRQAGFSVNVTPNQGAGAAMLRVEAARRLFPQIWFNDTAEIASGMKALAAYHERRDDKRNVGLGPKHDWASDPADSFGLIAIVYEDAKPKPQREKTHRPAAGGWMGR